MLTKFRSCIKFFGYPRARSVLREALSTSTMPGGKKMPKLDVKTRWNSTYEMINGYLAVKDAVRKCLEDEITSAQTLSSKRKVSSCILMPSENAALMELATLLKPFKEATKLMSGQKYTTIGMGLAIIKGLSAACAASETDSEFILSCKSKLNTQLTRYFYDAQGESIRPDIKTLVEVSAFL